LFYLLIIEKVEITLSIVSRPTTKYRGLGVFPRTLNIPETHASVI